MTRTLFGIMLLFALHARVVADEVDFRKDVFSVLQDRCVRCHGEDKQKGDLRLDSKQGAFAEDYIIVPGDAEDSELIARIILPDDDDDAMPPDGDRLSEEQITTIRKWIDGGAEWPDDVQVERYEPTPPPTARLTPIDPSEEEQQAIVALADMGIGVRPLAMDVVWTTARLRGKPHEEVVKALPLLAKVKTLTDLNLADCELTDQDVAHLAELENLTRLHLEKNPLTAAALAHLDRLTQLDYLNLYATQVADDGLQHLSSMEHLRKLYVWQTQVTDEGVSTLQDALPQLDIVRGAKLVIVETPATKSEEEKTADQEPTAEPADEAPANEEPAEEGSAEEPER